MQDQTGIQSPEIESIASVMQMQLGKMLNLEAALRSFRDTQQTSQSPHNDVLLKFQQDNSTFKAQNPQIKKPLPLRITSNAPTRNQTSNFSFVVPTQQIQKASKIIPSTIKNDYISSIKAAAAAEEEEDNDDEDKDSQEDEQEDLESLVNSQLCFQRNRFSTSSTINPNIQESQSSSNTSPLATADMSESSKYFLPFEGKLLMPQSSNSSFSNKKDKKSSSNSSNQSQEQLNYLASPFQLMPVLKQDDYADSYLFQHKTTQECLRADRDNYQGRILGEVSKCIVPSSGANSLASTQFKQVGLSPQLQTSASKEALSTNNLQNTESISTLSNFYQAIQSYTNLNQQGYVEQFKGILAAIIQKSAQNTKAQNDKQINLQQTLQKLSTFISKSSTPNQYQQQQSINQPLASGNSQTNKDKEPRSEQTPKLSKTIIKPKKKPISPSKPEAEEPIIKDQQDIEVDGEVIEEEPSCNNTTGSSKKSKKFPSVVFIEGNKKFECQICSKTFDSKQKLGGHKARAHPHAPCQRTEREHKKLIKSIGNNGVVSASADSNLIQNKQESSVIKQDFNSEQIDFLSYQNYLKQKQDILIALLRSQPSNLTE